MRHGEKERVNNRGIRRANERERENKWVCERMKERRTMWKKVKSQRDNEQMREWVCVEGEEMCLEDPLSPILVNMIFSQTHSSFQYVMK